MGDMVTAEALIGRTVRDGGGSPPGMAGGGDTGQGTCREELVTGHRLHTYGLQRRDTSNRMHLEEGFTHPQRERRIYGHRYGEGLMEDRGGCDKLSYWSGSPVPRNDPWFPGWTEEGERLP